MAQKVTVKNGGHVWYIYVDRNLVAGVKDEAFRDVIIEAVNRKIALEEK